MERNRLEDLGRIAELLHELMYESPAFVMAELSNQRFIESMRDADTAETFHYQLSAAIGKLYDIWHIARFGDDDG